MDRLLVVQELESLKLQGVPAIVDEKSSRVIHSGKVSLSDLIHKLESVFGVEEGKVASLNSDLGEYDVVVIGGGPAGASAAIYTARKGMKTAIIADKIGGQMQETKGIENFISIPYTQGPELSESLSKHISEYPIDLLEHRRVESLEEKNIVTHLTLSTGESLVTKSVILATGAKWRDLNVKGEKEYLGRGVAYCPHCDGPFYKGKDVIVVGGGNSGIEAAIDLSYIVKSVTVLEFSDTLRADKVLVQKANERENVKIIKSAQTLEVLGDGQKVTSLRYLDRKEEIERTIECHGIFVQIGLVPNTSFLKGFIELNEYGEIRAYPKT